MCNSQCTFSHPRLPGSSRNEMSLSFFFFWKKVLKSFFYEENERTEVKITSSHNTLTKPCWLINTNTFAFFVFAATHSSSSSGWDHPLCNITTSSAQWPRYIILSVFMPVRITFLSLLSIPLCEVFGVFLLNKCCWLYCHFSCLQPLPMLVIFC